MASTNVVMQSFDKGLRSGWLPEQLSTIAKLSRMFDENPVPTFVNAILVRLAEAFKDGSNEVRIGIARALSQCGAHLTLAFSSSEILRQITVVSHANDPSAREATLDVLASLSPIFPENCQAHHLICESLSTEHDDEFRAACNAMKSFAKLSSSFSEIVVLQIAKLLEDSTICPKRKVKLCNVFETMSANAQTMEQVFGLLDTLMHKSSSEEFLEAILESTTSLSIEIRYAIPKQIDVLLNLLSKCATQTEQSIIILIQLKRLAQYSNIWVEEQLLKFKSSLHPEMSKSTISHYFDVAVELSKSCSTVNLQVLKELASSSSAFGSMPSAEISVRYVQFATNVVCSPRAFENDTPESVNAMMTSLVIVIIATLSQGKLKERLAKKIYRSIGDVLIAFPSDQHQFSEMVISSIFSNFESNQKQALELMCRLIDTDKSYISNIHKWIINLYENRRDIFENHPQLFSYLLLAVGTKIPDRIDPVFSKKQDKDDDDRLKYSTALSAFRNGHWKKCAGENLKSIDVRKMSKSSADWIAALTELAQSELQTFDMESLANQQKHLRSTLSILNVSKSTSRFERDFRFASGMVSCMLETSEVFTHLHSIIEPFRKILSSALKPGQFFNPITAKRLIAAMKTVEQPINDAQTGWSTLCRSSFCADPTSLDLITLFYAKMSIMLLAVRVVLGKQTVEESIQLPSMSCIRTSTQMQLEQLQWAVDRIGGLKFETVPNIETVNTLYIICEQLATTPYMLPRFFFQQFYHVDFKITTTPQADKNKGVNVQNGETVPIRVDGVIATTHPSHIRQVVVFADVCYVTSHAHNFVWTETVEPNEQNYFTAQFLMRFKQSCEIKFRIEFVDSTSRKQWKSSATAGLSINVRDSGERGSKSTGGYSNFK